MTTFVASLRERTIASLRFAKSLLVQAQLDLGGDHRDTIFLAGSGRGGTTWIAEFINYDNAYRFIFEPFNGTMVPLCRDFGNRQYLRPGDADVRYVDPARAIVTGRFRNGWADYYNHRVVSRQRLIKDIRANLYLRWLYELFPGMPIVLVLRHPCAVAASRIRYGWGADLNQFLGQPQLVDDFLAPLHARLEAITDPFEAHIARWCVENYVPLRQFIAGEIHVAFYEDFRNNPRQEVERLFAFLGRPLNEKAFIQLERPSSMAWESAAGIELGGSRADSWRVDVSDDQVRRGIELLRAFGLDRLYLEEPTPRIAARDILPAAGGAGPKDPTRTAY